MTIWGIFQIILTFLEVAVCFGVCDALIYKKEFIKEHWIYTLLCVVVITYFVIINREIILFSYLVFAIQVLLIWGCLYLKGRKKGILSFALILDYNVVVMLLDFAFSFLTIAFLMKISGVSSIVRLEGEEFSYIFLPGVFCFAAVSHC